MLKNYRTVRVILYVLGIVAQVASFFVTIVSPELAAAFTQTANVLGAVALGTAVTNVPGQDAGDDEYV